MRRGLLPIGYLAVIDQVLSVDADKSPPLSPIDGAIADPPPPINPSPVDRPLLVIMVRDIAFLGPSSPESNRTGHKEIKRVAEAN